MYVKVEHCRKQSTKKPCLLKVLKCFGIKTKVFSKLKSFINHAFRYKFDENRLANKKVIGNYI